MTGVERGRKTESFWTLESPLVITVIAHYSAVRPPPLPAPV